MKKRSRTKVETAITKRLAVVKRHRRLYVGVDLHKSVMQVEIQNTAGVALLNEAFATDPRTSREVLEQLSGHVTALAIEATGFWYWFSDLCEEFGIQLVLANPRKLRVIADSVKKCDRLDAHWICEFLRLGYLEQAAVPDREARDRREILRTRQTVKGHVQDLKRRIRSFLNQYGLRTRSRDPFCGRGLAELRAMELRPWPRRSLNHLIACLEAMREQLKELDAATLEVAEEDGQAQFLQQEVRGIGPILAATILTETMDATRFANDHKYAAFTGLVPKVRESAGKQRDSGITKCGPRHLRWALVQAARLVVAHDPVVKKWYQRHRKRKGASRAYVMVAHKLARYVYLFAVHGVCFDAEKLFPPARRRRPAA